MMWEAWQTRRATKERTSRLLEDQLRRDFGPDWKIVASDLDQAVYEWGRFVEGKIDERVRAYYRQVDSSNAQRAAVSRSASRESYSHERVQEIGQEAVQYFVYGMVREYTDVPGDTPFSQTGRAYQERPATWDPEIDSFPDWDAPGTRVVYLDRPGTSEPEADEQDTS